MSFEFKNTKVPNRREAELFLRKWGQQFYDSPHHGDTGVPMDVHLGKEDAASDLVPVGSANTALWYTWHDMADELRERAQPFYSADKMASVIIVLRKIRDEGHSTTQDRLKNVHQIFCNEASKFEEGSHEWKLIEQAMHDYPGLRHATLTTIPEISKATQAIRHYASNIESFNDLGMSAAQGIYENLRMLGDVIDLKIKTLSVRKDGGVELKLDGKHLGDDQTANKVSALLTAISEHTDTEFNHIGLLDDGRVEFSFEGKAGNLITMNPREVANRSKELIRSGPQTLPVKKLKAADPLPPSKETQLFQAAFSAVGLRVANVEFQANHDETQSVTIYFSPPSDNQGLDGMLDPEVERKKIQTALTAIANSTGNYIEMPDIELVGGVAAFTLQMCGDIEDIREADPREVHATAMQIRDEGREGGASRFM